MRRTILFLLASVLVGVALRCAVTFKESPDCVYHLRRARFALQYFPRTVLFDPITNFPDGGICVWPPLFDLSLALPSLLWKGSDTSLASFEQTAMWVPIFYAAGAVAAAAMVGAAVRKGWGIAAGLFVATSPGHIQYSQFGHTDQHVAESLFGSLLLGFFLWSCKRSSSWLEFACGLSLTFAVLTWQGAIFWAPLLAVALIAEVLRAKYAKSAASLSESPTDRF